MQHCSGPSRSLRAATPSQAAWGDRFSRDAVARHHRSSSSISTLWRQPGYALGFVGEAQVVDARRMACHVLAGARRFSQFRAYQRGSNSGGAAVIATTDHVAACAQIVSRPEGTAGRAQYLVWRACGGAPCRRGLPREPLDVVDRIAWRGRHTTVCDRKVRCSWAPAVPAHQCGRVS